MATAQRNLSQYSPENVPSAADMSFGICVSAWNDDITGSLLEGARDTLLKHGAKSENIIVKLVPGSFELPLGGKWFFEKTQVDAVIAIGSVIQGETRHFDFVCEQVSHGIAELNLHFGKPAIFCVLTDNTKQQAIDRSGGKHGNKGVECAVAAIQMVALERNFKKEVPPHLSK